MAVQTLVDREAIETELCAHLRPLARQLAAQGLLPGWAELDLKAIVLEVFYPPSAAVALTALTSGLVPPLAAGARGEIICSRCRMSLGLAPGDRTRADR